jgi:hypothetical protein
VRTKRNKNKNSKYENNISTTTIIIIAYVRKYHKILDVICKAHLQGEPLRALRLTTPVEGFLRAQDYRRLDRTNLLRSLNENFLPHFSICHLSLSLSLDFSIGPSLSVARVSLFVQTPLFGLGVYILQSKIETGGSFYNIYWLTFVAITSIAICSISIANIVLYAKKLRVLLIICCNCRFRTKVSNECARPL